MKKVLIAFDGAHYSSGALEFARRLNEREPVLLTGVFIPQIDASAYWSYATGEAGGLYIPAMDIAKTEEIQINIGRFKTYCLHNDIDCRIHEDFNDMALHGLKKESRYADLLILGGELFYEHIGNKEPNTFLRETLQDAECPVLIVPEKFEYPDSAILAYDGSASSTFAIRQFSYLFPEFRTNKTLLVYAQDDNSENIPDEAYIEELAARHFTDLDLMKLHLNPSQYFATWAVDKKSAIVVTGAFGRSSFSRLFKKSFITDIIRDHLLPVFIAHR